MAASPMAMPLKPSRNVFPSALSRSGAMEKYTTRRVDSCHIVQLFFEALPLVRTSQRVSSKPSTVSRIASARSSRQGRHQLVRQGLHVVPEGLGLHCQAL